MLLNKNVPYKIALSSADMAGSCWVNSTEVEITVLFRNTDL